jgi:hypothetical protein
MSDLIQIQFITCAPIILVCLLALRFRLLQKVLRGLELEPEHIQFLQGILILIICYLTFLLIRDTWWLLR